MMRQEVVILLLWWVSCSRAVWESLHILLTLSNITVRNTTISWSTSDNFRENRYIKAAWI